MHRALHFGHLAVAGVLIEAGASLVIEDTKGRVPIDLISGPVNRVIANPLNSGTASEHMLSLANMKRCASHWSISFFSELLVGTHVT